MVLVVWELKRMHSTSPRSCKVCMTWRVGKIYRAGFPVAMNPFTPPRGLKSQASGVARQEFESQLSQIHDLQNAYLSLPRPATGFTRIEQGLVSLLSGQSGYTGRVLVAVAWSSTGAAL